MRPLIASIILLALPALGFAQGALTPAGAPAPTMKTLDQLEPRTPLKAGAPGVVLNANGGFTITASGSYYLTDNLTIPSGNAIEIQASYVTLDLSGFTLSSTESTPTGNGVTIANNLSDITIRNGRIRGNTVYNGATQAFSGTGFRNGIQSSVLNPNTVAENISVSNIIGDGIANFKKIDKCATSVCGGMGLLGYEILDSSADTCSGTAVYATKIASNCHGSSTKSRGIFAPNASNCYGNSMSNDGLAAFNASNCYGNSSSGYGLSAFYNAINCYGESLSGTGLYADTASNCSGRSDSGTALSALTASNCWAYTTSGSIAMDISGSAMNCRGVNANGGTSIRADIAVSCTSAGGTIIAAQKFLGTP